MTEVAERPGRDRAPSPITRPRDLLAAERPRWALWLPVAVGAGVGTYFALPAEPDPGLGLALLCIAIVWTGRAFRRASGLVPAAACMAVALGFVVAQMHTHMVAVTPMAEPFGPGWIEGRVDTVEETEGGAYRVVLASPRSDDAAQTLPARVRVRLLAGDPEPALGSVLGVRAAISAPSGPVAPGAFDFRRHVFFQGIGGIGYAVGHARVLTPPSGSSGLALAEVRRRINAAVVRAIGDPTRGAVAAALLTGQRQAVPEATYGALRDSGLAHLLAISGLHVGLVAGIVFVAVRAMCAAVPWVAVRYPIKKWAALAALVAALGYTVLVGSPVTTQRAFIMTGLVLLAVLLDRSPLSMRLVACAAVAVLLIAPESLTGPSFQMSFAAVLALIAAYEAWGPAFAQLRRRHVWAGSLVVYLGGVAFTTLIANLATAPFAVYHFHQFATYGLVANLLAVPLTAFWIMPWGVIGYLLMPFGLEAWPLAAMGWGLGLLLELAEGVAAWPAATILVPAMPEWGIVTIALGGLWLCLWQRAWRWAGAAAVVLGFLSIALAPQPDLLVSEDGRLMAVRGEDGRLSLSSGRRSSFVAERWLARDGQRHASTWPALGASPDGRLTCDPLGCIYHRAGHIVALPQERNALGEDCGVADILVAGFWITGRCAASVVIDRDTLTAYGAHAIYLDEAAAPVIRVATPEGTRRPWMPVRR